MDIEQLRDDAEIIRDETKSGANTAKRVGDMFVNIIDYINSGRMKITGSVNLTIPSSKTTLQNIYNSLDSGGMTFVLISDSKGLLLSTEKYITVNSSVRPLFTTDSSLGASVGDVVIVTNINGVPLYKIFPLNDAKASNGSFPGAMGLESIWDKEQINKIPNVEETANRAKTVADNNAFNTTGVFGDNMDTCFYNGFYPWCTIGRPAGSKGAFSLSVRRTATEDFNGNYTIQQTCYGREGDEIGQIWKRLIFKKLNASAEYGEWVRIDGNGGGDNVYMIPGRFGDISETPTGDGTPLGDASKLYDAINSGKVIKDLYNVITYVIKSSPTDYILIYQVGLDYYLITIRFNSGGQSYNALQRTFVESVVDNLTSSSSDKALSAKQGHILNERINTLNTSLDTFMGNISQQLVSVYRPKGSKTTFNDVLAMTDAKEGDVWNVERAFTIDGYEYAPGTNVVCIEDTDPSSHDESHWDSLGGMISGMLKESDVINNLTSLEVRKPLSANQGKVLNDKITALDDKINPLSLVVKGGTGSSGNTLASPRIVEKGTTLNDTLTCTFTKGGAACAFKSLTVDGAAVTVSGTGNQLSKSITVTADKTVACVATDFNGKSITTNYKYQFVDASYFGVVASNFANSPTAANITAILSTLTKSVKASKAYNTAAFTQNNQKCIYMYPSSFGALTKIVDGNNFDMTASFTKTTVTVNSISYLVYVLTSPSSVTNYTLKFS